MKRKPLKEALKKWDGKHIGIFDSFTISDPNLENIKFKEANSLVYKPKITWKHVPKGYEKPEE